MSQGRLNKVAWSEGMFLRPHHLQHHDLFTEARLHYHLRAVDPFHWGVREFVVDEEALADNRLVILRLDAVLPGGAIVRYPNGNATVEVREFDKTIERLDVHVGVRNLRPAEPNSAHADEGVRDVRTLVRSEELPDLNRGGFAAEVEVSELNVRVFFGGEEQELELHESIKLAEIEATGELAQPFALSKTYAPPLLAIQGFPVLAEEVAKITSQISGKIRVIAGRMETLSTVDLERTWMRYTLARMTPVFTHLLSTGETRPFDLYTAFVETVGALAAFAEGEAIELPLYDHENLYGCFHALIQEIDVRLEGTLPQRFERISLPFVAEKSAYVTESLNTESVDPRNAYFLGVKPPTNMEVSELASTMKEHAKASSVKGVFLLAKRNLAGLTIEHLPGPPTEIQGKLGFEYFSVDTGGTHWKRVMDEFSFALNLGKLETAEVDLYVVKPES